MTAVLGIDFGTSGARAIALDASSMTVLAQAQVGLTPKTVADPASWQQALTALIGSLPSRVRDRIERVAINGTSATVLLCDRALRPVTAPLLYNDATGAAVLDEVRAIAPPDSPVLSATSSLAKALWWRRVHVPRSRGQSLGLVHQADWLAAQFHGQRPVSDYHNALKLGYDVSALSYPNWLLASSVADWLPPVQVPGSVIGPISSRAAACWSLPRACQVCVGTTDSIAAFLASGADEVGTAVTSLGSTLVLKVLSDRPVADSRCGIYSHRLGALWLPGGASNTGGAVLRQFFSATEIATLSEQIDLTKPCSLDYYPLVEAGERFPVDDPSYPPRLTPRPASDVQFLYGLLSGIARIEAAGYKKLASVGAPNLRRVLTAGGGAQNTVWQRLRQQLLGVPVIPAAQTDAAYGSALLALRGLSRFER